MYTFRRTHNHTKKKIPGLRYTALYERYSHWLIFFKLMNNCTQFCLRLGRGNVHFIHIHAHEFLDIYPVFRWVMIGWRDALRRTGLADIFATIANTLYGIDEELAKITFFFNTHTETQRKHERTMR